MIMRTTIVAGTLLTLTLSAAFRAQAQTNGLEADYVWATYPSQTNYFLGRTGIGTNAPCQQLHVVGDSRLEGSLEVTGSFRVPKQGDVSMGPYTNGISDRGIVVTNLALQGAWLSYDGSASGIYVSSGGAVGVGTGAPGVQLDVAGDGRVSGDLEVGGTINGTATDADSLGGLAATQYMVKVASPSVGAMLRYDGTNWVAASAFVSAGDPTNYNFLTAAFVKDDQWHDLSLTNLVPSGAKAVAVTFTIQDNIVGNPAMLRCNGNTGEFSYLGMMTQAANVYMSMSGIVICNANREIEYKVGSGMNFVGLAVTGWWY